MNSQDPSPGMCSISIFNEYFSDYENEKNKELLRQIWVRCTVKLNRVMRIMDILWYIFSSESEIVLDKAIYDSLGAIWLEAKYMHDTYCTLDRSGKTRQDIFKMVEKYCRRNERPSKHILFEYTLEFVLEYYYQNRIRVAGDATK